MKRSMHRIAASYFGFLLSVPLCAQITQRVSVSTSGAQGSGGCGAGSVSNDGRYVAFDSSAPNLVPGDTNGTEDVFVRDRQAGTTERVSVATDGTQGDFDSSGSVISPDGRFVGFSSGATNLVGGDTNGRTDAFIHDRLTGTTERVSVSTSGVQANSDCYLSSFSPDGRFVVFSSLASNLVSGDTNGKTDVFVRDRQQGTTERVSLSTFDVEGNGWSIGGLITPDGRWVAFSSYASNLVIPFTNGTYQVFIRDRFSHTTALVSVDPAGITEANFECFAGTLSSDGRFVAFQSAASNLVAGDTNGVSDVFVRDLFFSATERVSLDSLGMQANSGCNGAAMSPDGRYVAFVSDATNLVSGDSNASPDVFLRDRQTGTTERVSINSSGTQGNSISGYSFSLSADGRYVAFTSIATNLVPGDTNALEDVFLRDRSGGTLFTSLCDPGVGGVITCPCSNPPSAPGRGCNNSAATGGAILSASGGAYLSSDSLVFATSGEKPTATSILWQGNALAASGIVFGQGVRCANGNLKRLFAAAASAGSITVPNFGAGDPSVSTRSAAKGDTILAGQSRWYWVSYRDPIVPGGCLAGSTFNATQTGRIDWLP